MLNGNSLDCSNKSLLDSNFLTEDTFYNAVDPEVVSAGVQTAAALAAAAKDRPRNTVKKDLKAVCGRKPLLKKKRAEWDKCASDYMKSKSSESTSSQSSASEAAKYIDEPTKEEKKFLGMPMGVGVTVTVVAVAAIGFFAYKTIFANKS